MTVTKAAEEQIQRLQLMEQSLQSLLAQKQNFQLRLMEIDSALSELEKVDSAYRIIGSIMVAAPSSKLLEELGGRKETTQLRIASLEKQEESIRQKAAELQKQILGQLQEEK